MKKTRDITTYRSDSDKHLADWGDLIKYNSTSALIVGAGKDGLLAWTDEKSRRYVVISYSSISKMVPILKTSLEFKRYLTNNKGAIYDIDLFDKAYEM